MKKYGVKIKIYKTIKYRKLNKNYTFLTKQDN